MTPIPQYLLDRGIRTKCHVEGWNQAAVFVHQKTVAGEHFLKTPKSGVLYRTRNRLLFTRKGGLDYIRNNFGLRAGAVQDSTNVGSVQAVKSLPLSDRCGREQSALACSSNGYQANRSVPNSVVRPPVVTQERSSSTVAPRAV